MFCERDALESGPALGEDAMAFREPVLHPRKTLVERKTLAEGAVCFACALAGLTGIALVLQWLVDFMA
ncbi:MAG: hypothetical protein ABS78_04915 [Phenylobacterium sp. SCN 70-31]|nr:MAG: hypothetical protein ABS78_04915 [Phenylobacterium sp. SCN 70-31]